jgi:hypothetical protein
MSAFQAKLKFLRNQGSADFAPKPASSVGQDGAA